MSPGPNSKSSRPVKRQTKNPPAARETVSSVHMGNTCTTVGKDEESELGEPHPQQPQHIAAGSEDTPPSPSRSRIVTRAQAKLTKRLPHRRSAPSLASRNLKRKYDSIMAGGTDVAAITAAEEHPAVARTQRTLEVLERNIEDRKAIDRKKPCIRRVAVKTPALEDDDYDKERAQVTDKEAVLAFDFDCRATASAEEKEANEILEQARRLDEADAYGKAGQLKGHHQQAHPRHPGDHFLTNVDLIEETRVFKVAQRMPKGAHLHIHFNSCLKPEFLLNLAKKQERMDIGSNMPLVKPEHGHERDYLNECEIQFSIRGKNPPNPPVLANLFEASESFPAGKPAKTLRWMNYGEFRDRFRIEFPDQDLDQRLVAKLVYSADEAHNVHQTAKGAWAKFNGRTRMMKGLFNYETAYREYTKACLQDFVDDNIQYAEIRPNFMRSNQVWSEDATELYDNKKIMEIIIDECNKFLEKRDDSLPFFQGIKVIYCAPRSFGPALIKQSLEECLALKLTKGIGHIIAGFDLVGEEGAGLPLKDHAPNLNWFKKECEKRNVDIPLLLHCGETLEMGTETDGNLVDALILGSKRIGHGFALARHPFVMEKMKKQGICLEVCPISNEILGLTPRIGGHAMYNLLANDVQCTVNSDNGTLFRSSLSHDFYQVFIGRNDFTLHGWRQLIQWSLDHSCLDDAEYRTVLGKWELQWGDFLKWIIANKGDLLQEDKEDKGGKKPT